MKIGILIICTGKYTIFFNDLYKSCETFFLTNHKKTYYVFTDGNIPKSSNIVRIEQPSLGWPFNTMNRFHMFCRIADVLIEEDFLFFLNANMICVDNVGEEIVPVNQYLMAVQHPGYMHVHPSGFPYERNKHSNFYIPYNKGKIYYQGCFNGGRSAEFMEMADTLMHYIDDDLLDGIIPVWHDESALNWYLLNKEVLTASVQYASPEGWGIANPKIMSRDKNKWGGHTFLRS